MKKSFPKLNSCLGNHSQKLFWEFKNKKKISKIKKKVFWNDFLCMNKSFPKLNSCLGNHSQKLFWEFKNQKKNSKNKNFLAMIFYA